MTEGNEVESIRMQLLEIEDMDEDELTNEIMANYNNLETRLWELTGDFEAETFEAFVEKENERHTVNELLGKEVKIFPSDSYSKFGIIEQINENGVLFKITRTPGYSEPRDWSKTDTHTWLVGTLVWYSWNKLVFRTIPTDNKDAETLTPQKDTGTWKIGRDDTFPSGKLDFTPPQPKTITPKSPSASIPSWATQSLLVDALVAVTGLGLGFLGIRELGKRV